MRRRHRDAAVFLILALLFIFSFFLALGKGSTDTSFMSLFSGSPSSKIVIFSLRLPRALASILAGMAFSISGLLLQDSTTNSLASPNVVGINAGAGFSVLLFLAFFPQLHFMLPVVSFIGAFVAVSLVLFVGSCFSGHDDRSILVLAGVAVSALFNAGVAWISALYPDVLAAYSSFSIGGFAGVYMDDIKTPGLVIIICLVLSFMLIRPLSFMSLGDEIASSYGIKVRRVRKMAIVLASALAASAVTFSGLLGFVGLVVPHIAKFMFGENIGKRMAGCLLCGPALVMLSDLLGRAIAPPAELPCGIFMALLGVPFFFLLLFQRRKEW